jgi:RES domain-containing protein
VRLWRITDARYLATAFTGDGAAVNGGRWNSRGTKVVYTSMNLSTAILEVLVHVDPSNAPTTLVKIPLDVPDTLGHDALPISSLPPDWTRYPASPALAQLGDASIAQGTTAMLFVPSVVVLSDDEPKGAMRVNTVYDAVKDNRQPQ